jgi:hypothetical protein
MIRHTEIIDYRWTALDATAAQVGSIIDIWATPYRIRPRELDKGRRGLKLGLPGLAEDGFLASDADFGFDVGELVSFSLALTVDPPSVARFFREGYEWVDLPEEIDPDGKTIQGVMEACFELDPVRFAHFDPATVYASFAARNAANWPELVPKSPFHVPAVTLNPYNYPWGDLAMLHFEYWENTDLRGALINQHASFEEGVGWLDVLKGTGAIALFLLKGDPWTGIWGDIWPWQLPAKEGEHVLKKVLAKTPLRGVPIRALPTTPEDDGTSERMGRVVTVVSMPPPSIELDGFGRQTITPLRDPVGLFGSGPTLRASKLRFRITVPFPALTTRIEIFRGDSLYFREVHETGEFLIPGEHVWAWDGYDQDGVFDSQALKSRDLSARLTVTDLKGRTSVATMWLSSAPDKHRWVDLRIDTDDKQIDVTVFSQFRSPSEMNPLELKLPVDNLSTMIDDSLGWMAGKAAPGSGGAVMGMLPSMLDAWPADAGSLFEQVIDELTGMLGLGGGDSGGSGGDLTGDAAEGAISKYTGMVPGMLNTGEVEVGSELGKILKGSDLDQDKFERLRTAILTGIHRHWSRTVSIEGEEWTLTVNAKERGHDAQVTYLSSSGGILGDIRGEDADRSFNLALVEGLPVFNIWDESRVMPQSHVDRGWITDVDARFATTGAHELGHQVLIERKDWLFSITHKGTSTIGQAKLPDSPFHVEEDELGNSNWEIDIMYYFNADSSRPPENWQERYCAEEADACVLISMGKVSFG